MSILTAMQALLAPLVAPGLLILAEQNGPRPEKPYATLAVRRTTLSNPIQHEPDAAGLAEVVVYAGLIVEVQHYGRTAYDDALDTSLKLRFPSVVQRAGALGVSINQIRAVNRIPELLDQSQYEERGLLEFSASAFLSGVDDVGLIESNELECFGHIHLIEAPPRE